ncbi:glycoside hydrolase family 95 protein [Tamlana sp. 2201CG12-4]|uniref:glycoside hydrolase family 95 protein n=1 Tax=Tamlana sp. 2201CG12-4 TaxID=3112582 RepID=UPI002DB8DEC7|nr:glycoside hydrolase family 95 protein [Tamlana sp. 2201CG12-4]MEC3907878.1 glycoside hydrolase family 95 protein [Tamlana sp. 2201CG12-4]
MLFSLLCFKLNAIAGNCFQNIILGIGFLMVASCSNNKTHSSIPLKIWFDTPTTEWNEGLPLGNGRIGAMVLGHPNKERIALNEETLWSGFPKDGNNPKAKDLIPEIREALAKGDFGLANTLTIQTQGPYTQSYAPMGDLYLDFEDKSDVTNYYRDLDLSNAITTSTYKRNGVNFRHELFVSAPDQVMVMRISSNKKAKVSFTASLSSKLQFNTVLEDNNTLVMKGKAPMHADPNYLGDLGKVRYTNDEGMTFECRLLLKNQGGEVIAEDNKLKVVDADKVLLLVSPSTSFNGYNKSPGNAGKNPELESKHNLVEAYKKSYMELKENHVRDYTSFFNRVQFAVSNIEKDTIPTYRRLKAYDKTNPDLHLDELIFHYGRYLLISSSRPGGIPANLQGIWNQDVRPPWSSNFTANINVQMNYWIAEPLNLPEMHKPLLDFVSNLSVNGAKTAKINYGMRGWCSHHNTDIWASTNPVGNISTSDKRSPSWANFPMSGAWFSKHVYEHYTYNRDTTYLRNHAYPIMKGAARFVLDWLWEGPDGYLVTGPSVSPENFFMTNMDVYGCVDIASTSDIGLIRDLFTNTIAATNILKTDVYFKKEIEMALKQLPPFKIGQYGQLQEWYNDWDNPEDTHRHIAHLFALHPGNQISPHTTPELAEACKRTLNMRGDAGTGWSLAWKINFWARLFDGDKAHNLLTQLYNPVAPTNYTMGNLGGGCYPNLLDACPPFQIDGNFGAPAGILEMLMQSHLGEIHLLPALPSVWKSGYIKGIKANGAYQLDIEWNEGKLKSLHIRSKATDTLRLRYLDLTREIVIKAGEELQFDKYLNKIKSSKSSV